MNYKATDFRLLVTESTDFRIGIGEDFWWGTNFHGVQARFEDGTAENFPFYTILGWYVEGTSNVIFSEDGKPIKTLSFSDRMLFDAFRKSPALGSVRAKVLSRISDVLALKNVEYLPEIDSKGMLTSRLVDRKVAHEEGIGHISTHYWAVNPDAFREMGDIGIYMGKRSAEKSATGKAHWQRLWGGHVGFSASEIEASEPFADDGRESVPNYVNPKLRKYVSYVSVLREIEEETGIRLERKERVPSVSASGGIDYDSLLPSVPALKLVEFNAPYASVTKKIKNGQEVVEDNNERVDVYAFEFRGDITGFDRREIDAVELVPSSKMLEMLENDPEMFWGKTDGSWKTSHKYLMAKSVIEKLRKDYGVA